MSKLFGENGCLKDRYETVCIYLHGCGQGIDCTKPPQPVVFNLGYWELTSCKQKRLRDWVLFFDL